jgi:anti-sigma-K factor RskA
MRCADISPNLPAFVLGGMEPEEEAEIRRHLATCPVCRDELEEFSKVNRALQAAPPPAEPPGHLKEEILARVRAEQLSLSDEAAPSVSARYRSRYSRLAIAGVAAAALVAMVAIGIVFGSPDEPPVATIELIPTPGEANALEGYWGVAELHPQPSGNQQVELRLINFEEPEPNSYYEVWFASGAERISAGSFTSVGEGETRVSLTVAPEARNARTLLITEEHPDGDPAPSEKVALKGEIPE